MSEENQTSEQQTPTQQPQAQQPEVKTGLAVTSLVFGIIGLFTSLIFVGALFGAVGLVLGIIALSKKQPKGMSVTGIVLSLISILIVVAISVFAVGFFKDASEKAGIDFDTSDNGFSIESEDGEGSFSVGGDLPDGFPAEVPLYEPAEVTSSASYSENDGRVYNVTLNTDDLIASVDDFYSQSFADDWDVHAQTAESGEYSNYTAGQNDLEVSVSIIALDDGANINLSVTQE